MQATVAYIVARIVACIDVKNWIGVGGFWALAAEMQATVAYIVARIVACIGVENRIRARGFEAFRNASNSCLHCCSHCCLHFGTD